MLFYYSATGITQKLALTIAERTNETAISIEDALKNEAFDYELKDSERLGFLSPVYFGSIPDILKDFIKKLKIKTAEHYYCFIALTFGSSPFNAANHLTTLLLRNGITTNAIFGAAGIDTFIPFFTIPAGEQRKMVEDRTNTQNALIAEQVADRTQINDIKPGPFPRLTTAISAPIYTWMRRTNNFVVSDACNGCGLCAKNCPEQAITIDPDAKHPTWTKPKCLLCFRCLHHCPTTAIDYANATKGKLRLKSYPLI